MCYIPAERRGPIRATWTKRSIESIMCVKEICFDLEKVSIEELVAATTVLSEGAEEKDGKFWEVVQFFLKAMDPFSSKLGDEDLDESLKQLKVEHAVIGLQQKALDHIVARAENARLSRNRNKECATQANALSIPTTDDASEWAEFCSAFDGVRLKASERLCQTYKDKFAECSKAVIDKQKAATAVAKHEFGVALDAKVDEYEAASEHAMHPLVLSYSGAALLETVSKPADVAQLGQMQSTIVDQATKAFQIFQSIQPADASGIVDVAKTISSLRTIGIDVDVLDAAPKLITFCKDLISKVKNNLKDRVVLPDGMLQAGDYIASIKSGTAFEMKR